MKNKATFVLCLLTAIWFLWSNHLSIYDAIYGQEGERSSRLEIPECRIALFFNNNDASTHHKLAYLLMDNALDAPDSRQRVKESVQEYLATIKLNPTDGDAYFDLGRIYDTQYNDIETANALYQKCVEISPTDSTFQSFLADSYYRMGKEKEAEYHRRLGRRLGMFPPLL